MSSLPPKSPTDADRSIGLRIRARRMLIGMSQERLGELLGVTFQQIQKYEKGINRLSAGRLPDIADVLGVPIMYLYEGASGRQSGSAENADTVLSLVLRSPEVVRLSKAFAGIGDSRVRQRIIALVEALSTTE